MAHTTAQPTKRRDSMPQPKQTDTEAKAKAEAEAKAKADWIELVAAATEGDTSGARQVQRAITLEAQLSELREKVNDNRTYLRMMQKNDELTEDQAEFVDVFYPEKEKGERRPAEEVEATRLARALARENGAAKKGGTTNGATAPAKEGATK